MADNDILSIGELIVEIMRKEVDVPLSETGDFVGPFPSGAPAIFADQAARLGHKVGFIGACGADDFGHHLLARLQSDGLDVSAIARIDDVATGAAFVTYFSNGERTFIFHIGNSAAARLPQPDPAMFQGLQWLHICGSSLSAGNEMQSKCYRACELAVEAGAQISLDPNLRPELLGGAEAVREVCQPVLDAASLILPSSDEAQTLTGQGDADAACRALIDAGARIVALKQGAQGCKVFTCDGKLQIPGFPVQAVDPTGAGDCFDAGFVAAMVEELPLAEAGRLANACGALATTEKGPMEGAFTRETVDQFIAQAT